MEYVYGAIFIIAAAVAGCGMLAGGIWLWRIATVRLATPIAGGGGDWQVAMFGGRGTPADPWRYAAWNVSTRRYHIEDEDNCVPWSTRSRELADRRIQQLNEWGIG